MSRDMKLIMESFKTSMSKRDTLLEMCSFDKEEGAVFEHLTLEEGVIDFGKGLLNKVKTSYEKMKGWAENKKIDFVKKMGNGYNNFISKLREKGVIKKYAARREQQAMKLLLTNKHIDLALLLMTSLFNLVGGSAIETLIQTPEILKKFMEVTKHITSGAFDTAIETLFGEDVPDVIEVIRKAMDYHKDLNDPNKKIQMALGNFEEFGGMAEALKRLGIIQ